MALEENKKELVKFLFQEWAHPRRYYNFFSSDSALYVNVTEKFYKIKRVGNEVVFEEEAGLETTQEEADTKVFLSAAHCQSNNIQSCCISTNDTDIVYYAMYYQTTLQINLFIEFGSGDRRRMLSIPRIVQHLGENVSKALPGLHCFSGNDYASAFYGLGKIKAFNLMKTNDEFIQAFAAIGRHFVFDSCLFKHHPNFCLQIVWSQKL